MRTICSSRTFLMSPMLKGVTFPWCFFYISKIQLIPCKAFCHMSPLLSLFWLPHPSSLLLFWLPHPWLLLLLLFWFPHPSSLLLFWFPHPLLLFWWPLFYYPDPQPNLLKIYLLLRCIPLVLFLIWANGSTLCHIDFRLV